MEKKLDGNYTRMLWSVLNKSWRLHATKQQLYGHLSPITKSIQVRRTRHVGHSWKSKDELISDELRWNPSHGRVKIGRPARTNIQQLYANTGCNLKDLLGPMDDRDGWRERVREICASSMTWWWQWLSLFHLVGLWQTKCSIIWRVLNISVELLYNIMINEYILVFICI